MSAGNGTELLSFDDLPAISTGSSSCWQPAYTLYGGADRFTPETPSKMLYLARQALKAYPWLLEGARKKVERRLGQPLDDFRIDFEDGYGRRSDEEEDLDAEAVGLSLPQADALKRCGVRLKPLTREQAPRALRTLEKVIQPWTVWPVGFCVTLPKIEEPAQLFWMLQQLERLEGNRGHLALEMMIESPRALGHLESLVKAAGKRLRGVHFGPYDFLAGCGIAQPHLHSPLTQFARAQLLLETRSRGLELSDGPTTLLPIPPHRGPNLTPVQQAENQKSVRQAWELHREDILQSRACGMRQGWLLHPHQLVSQAAAQIQELESLLPRALEGLERYWKSQGKATSKAGDFDDRATARQWLQVVEESLEIGVLDTREPLTRLPVHWREV